MSSPTPYLDGEAPEMMSGEIKLALTALKSRLHRAGKYEEWKARVDELYQQSIAGQELGHKALNRSKRMAQVAAAKFFPVPLAQLDPAELPLWGYKSPSHVSHQQRRKVGAALLEGGATLEAALSTEPLLQPVKEMAEEERRLQWLVMHVPSNIEADTKAIVKWVIDHLLISLDSVTPESVPARSALILLKECRSDDDFRRDFLKKWMDKFLPTKQQVEYEQMFQDDGRKHLELVNRVLEGEQVDLMPAGEGAMDESA